MAMATMAIYMYLSCSAALITNGTEETTIGAIYVIHQNSVSCRDCAD